MNKTRVKNVARCVAAMPMAENTSAHASEEVT